MEKPALKGYDLIIASRELSFCAHGSEEFVPMSVSISLPTAPDQPDDFFGCELRLTGPLPRTETVYGTDALQAISLAIFSFVNHLRMLEGMGMLLFPDGDKYSVDEDFGFIRKLSEIPIPPEIE